MGFNRHNPEPMSWWQLAIVAVFILLGMGLLFLQLCGTMVYWLVMK